MHLGARHLIHWILDSDGEPVEASLMEWAMWLEHHRDARVVEQTRISAAVAVSTVFLGLDHSWTNEGPPVLWETMTFGGVFDQYQDRYTSKLDALRGHLWAVELVRLYDRAPRRTRKALKKWQTWGQRLGRDEQYRLARVFRRLPPKDE